MEAIEMVDPPIYSIVAMMFDGEARYNVGKELYNEKQLIGKVTQIDRNAYEWGIEYIVWYHNEAVGKDAIHRRFERMSVTPTYDVRAGL